MERVRAENRSMNIYKKQRVTGNSGLKDSSFCKSYYCCCFFLLFFFRCQCTNSLIKLVIVWPLYTFYSLEGMLELNSGLKRWRTHVRIFSWHVGTINTFRVPDSRLPRPATTTPLSDKILEMREERVYFAMYSRTRVTGVQPVLFTDKNNMMSLWLSRSPSCCVKC